MSRVHAAVPIQIILLILLAFLFTSSSTQYEVTGVLVDQNQDPVASLSVLLLNENDEQIASDQTDSLGHFTLVYQVEPTSADPSGSPDMPVEFKLGSSYPNPFNPRTTVPFYAPENTQAVITVYNILGQQVMRTQADLSAGSHEIQVNLGGRLSQGQYILRVQGDGFSHTQAMTFVSAGIGGGNPEIRVRQGGNVTNRTSGSMHQMDSDIEYRIVVEATERYQGKEMSITPFENLDMGSLMLAMKQEDDGDWPRDTETEIVEVTSATGRVWMDRNLGASRAATSSTDTEAYGDLYQWGRPADGHQLRNSPTTSTLSSIDQTDHGSFILVSDDPYDWRSPQNNNLWQGEDGVNNPCPVGYRIPTEAEWEEEIESWGSEDATGAYTSPLKLPMAGIRVMNTGSLVGIGSRGWYWSSTIANEYVQNLRFHDSSDNAGIFNIFRADGNSVRCIKDSDTYSINLKVSPSGSGSVTDAGKYGEGAEVNITATANEGYTFVSWSGDTGHIADAKAASTTVTMPSYDISLTANFKQDEDNGDGPRDTETEIVEVTSATGRVWMDRNLGASRAATSSTDSLAYGDMYQWGRASDGHQLRTSDTTSTLSTTDQQDHGSFILSSSDWRSPRNNNLWQGVNGINNPCPAGYRLPTEAEWNAERNSWGSNSAAGAFGSPLKLPMAGGRSPSSGSLLVVGSGGGFWSSTVSGSDARNLYFNSSTAGVYISSRAAGLSVRCLKD